MAAHKGPFLVHRIRSQIPEIRISSGGLEIAFHHRALRTKVTSRLFWVWEHRLCEKRIGSAHLGHTKSLTHWRIQGSPAGPGPSAPKICSKSCSFEAILSKVWVQGRPWGQNSAGPPDQNPWSAPATNWQFSETGVAKRSHHSGGVRCASWSIREFAGNGAASRHGLRLTTALVEDRVHLPSLLDFN